MGNSDELKELLKAAAMLNERISKIAGEKKEMLFGEFAQNYLREKLAKPTIRESTKRAFEYQLRMNLLPAFGHLPIGSITNSVWLGWVKSCREAPKPRTNRFFNARKGLIELLHAAKEAGHIDRTPKLENPDEPKKVGRILTDEEFHKLIRNTTYRIFRLFFFVLRRTGCRPREILQWEWDFIHWDEPGHSWISIPARISKTGRNREIALHPQVSRQLYRIFKRGVRSRFVFPNRIHPDRPQLSYHGAWSTALKKAKLTEHAVPYDNRRTFITYAMADNQKPVFVAQHLDTSVKQIETTYTKKHVPSMEEVARGRKKD